MKNNFRYLSYFLGIICSIAFLSCLDEDYFLEQFEKKYNKQWENIFGKMDPNHDWNIIQQVNATVQVSEAGEHTLRIYTDHPKNKQSRLIAQIPVEGTGTIRFDLEKISKDVYARVKDAQGKVTFEGYFAVNGGEVLIDEGNIVSRLASRDATSGTSLSSATIINLPTAYRDGLNEYKELYGEYKDSTSNPVNLGNLYYFNNGTTFINSNDFTWTKFKEDIIPIVNYDTYFGESNRSNRDKSAAGVEYVTIKEGPVELSYVYGATGLRNSFGYFYWTGNIDFSSDEGKNKFSNIPKIILMNDASPQANLRLAEEESTSWDNALKLNDIQNGALSNSLKLLNYVYNSTHNQNPPEAPNYVIGSKYSLVYYGDNYDETGTYIFPKDVHIGFFLYTSYWNITNKGFDYSFQNSPIGTNNEILKTIVYSIPQLNYNIKEYYDYRYSETKNNNNTGDSSRGEISAVTFQFHGQKLLGFEDGVDKDMNDIMLLVDADVEVKDNNSAFEEQDKNYTEPEPEPQSWIIACEDMGNIGDYDFNDAVFKVSHVAGTNQLKVTPLAAGGTYSIIVKYNDWNISTYTGQGEKDFHQLINSNASGNNGLWQQINDKSKGSAGAEITITDNTLINNPFSLANNDYNNHGFSVYVEKNNGASITITQPEHKRQQAPQMLVLPEYWIWPYEGRSIHLGYSGFEAWTNKQSENEDWYTKPNKTQSNRYLVDYNSFSNYPNNGEGEVTPTPTKTLPFIVDNAAAVNYTVDGAAGNYCITIPTSWFKSNNATITFTGANSSSNNIALKKGDSQIVHTSTNIMTISDISQMNGVNSVNLHFWMSDEQFGKITGIVIKNVETPNIPTSIPLTVDNQQRSNLDVTTGDYGCYVEIPKNYISANGATVTITATGDVNAQIFKDISSSGNDYGFSNSNGTYTCELSADQVNQISVDPVKLYFWDTSISTVTGINITNKIGVSGFNGEKIDGYTIYTIPILDPYKADNVNGIKVTVTLTSAQATYVAFFSNKSNYTNHDVHSPQQIQAGQSYEFTISKDKYQYLSNIYTGTQDQNAGIASISVEVVETTTTPEEPSEDDITFTVDGVAQSNLTLVPAANGKHPYIEIPKSAFGSNGTTITFTSTENLGGQLDHNNGSISINNNSIIVPSSTYQHLPNPVKVQVWNGASSITAISITNKSGDDNPGAADYGTSINFTKDNKFITISKNQLNDITTGSKLYFLDENNQTIEANHNIKTNIENVVWTYNNSSNPYIITANNVEVINRSDVDYIIMEFWDAIPTKIYLKKTE